MYVDLRKTGFDFDLRVDMSRAARRHQLQIYSSAEPCLAGRRKLSCYELKSLLSYHPG
jgi:hypothetical protein